jgi:hypothetical protein
MAQNRELLSPLATLEQQRRRRVLQHHKLPKEVEQIRSIQEFLNLNREYAIRALKNTMVAEVF